MSNTEVKLLSADCSEGLPLVRLGRRHANSILIKDGIFISIVTVLEYRGNSLLLSDCC